MSSKIVSMRNVSIELEQGPVLQSIDWNIKRGEHWAVLGPNGAGKTTLFRVLAGAVWPDDDKSREYYFDGKKTYSPIDAQERIYIVSPEQQDVFLKMGWDVSGEEAVLAGKDNTPFLYRLADEWEYEEVRSLMKTLGMESLAKRSIVAMSRGEGRKILIARALIARAEVIILDEFLEGIDQKSRAQLIEAIDAAAAAGITIVCSAHRDEELPTCINRTLHLADGKIDRCEDGLGKGVSCFIDGAQERIPPAVNRIEAGKTLFRLCDASVVFLGNTVLKNVDWEMNGGQNWAVLGDNGAGKSTLLRLLYGDAAAYAAEKQMERLPEKGDSLRSVRGRMGMVSASLQASFGEAVGRPIRILDLVISGFFASVGLFDEITDELREKAYEWLKFFGIEDLAERTTVQLSYGQLRKAFIARALVSEPDVLLLDEPLAGVDAASRKEIYNLLESLAAAGVAMVYVTHHKEELIPSISHVLEITDGKISFNGEKEEYLQSR
ncbi:molybdate transport system ATP-binding protein [Maridesulfovibrio ferrireducens]|uniref:Molybdate transport system ATP-binding protein n=1 Tax=Maridesulfovibrio ferrireducens TaxID=246191 RepID=A0A1G9FB57_9BACT|nr:ATP-binding cassette domain-containing protein [Maridesulfovibrio ferrireducens]SDK85634.1 molybdate transport system ATP-binding protein [Maridesulfovibrio ferrireducens]